MELEQALVKTQDCKGLIIDLRGNTGGLLGNAIFLADKFIKDGDIVKIVSRDSKVAESYKANPAAKKLDKPVVILINGTSASASEIFSGAMTDYKRAVLVGETTFGKGMVQSVVPLPNKTGVNITIAKYLTPAGTDINEKGVQKGCYYGDDFSQYYFSWKLGKIGHVALDGRGDFQGKIDTKFHVIVYHNNGYFP